MCMRIRYTRVYVCVQHGVCVGTLVGVHVHVYMRRQAHTCMIMHDDAWWCTMMHDYAWGCMRMHEDACTCMHACMHACMHGLTDSRTQINTHTHTHRYTHTHICDITEKDGKGCDCKHSVEVQVGAAWCLLGLSRQMRQASFAYLNWLRPPVWGPDPSHLLENAPRRRGQHHWGRCKCHAFWQRDFWVTPVSLLVIFPKMSGRTFFPNLSKFTLSGAKRSLGLSLLERRQYGTRRAGQMRAGQKVQRL